MKALNLLCKTAYFTLLYILSLVVVTLVLASIGSLISWANLYDVSVYAYEYRAFLVVVAGGATFVIYEEIN